MINFKFLDNICRDLAQLLLKHKQLILFFYKVLVFSGLAMVLLTWIIPFFYPFWKELGKFSGSASVILLFITLLPGMMKRFGVRGCLQSTQIVLMSYRRYAGIAMYLAATSHYLWIKFLPAIVLGISPWAANTFELMGTVALMTAFPLFLTANDQSIRWLKKKWQLLHKLTYAVLFFIALHLWLLKGLDSITLAITLVLLLEIASYLVSAARKNSL